MDLNKVKGYLNISHKGGYLIIGGENLKSYNKKLYSIIYDESALKNTLKILEQYKESIPIVKVKNLEELSSIKNCKIIGIKNKKLSEIIISLLSN